MPLPEDTRLIHDAAAVDNIINKLGELKPTFIIIAAGFDTHIDDPIGGLKPRTEDYISIGSQFTSLNVPTLICQEGGYNVDTPRGCVKNFLSGFMGARQSNAKTIQVTDVAPFERSSVPAALRVAPLVRTSSIRIIEAP